ncbi:TonB family protein [Dysgonomonas alginatilytica]|uniref:TonB family protein n=1 Tax=Dysgonomonas alginatilytica TaxID=1605892 RepID=A0A2V3PK95_9BACT|nr:TonB family protein [Dysgonomonas alginatilytica]PXV58472.1 TonB family protein [Dysgonomonas alginatilytica]
MKRIILCILLLWGVLNIAFAQRTIPYPIVKKQTEADAIIKSIVCGENNTTQINFLFRNTTSSSITLRYKLSKIFLRADGRTVPCQKFVGLLADNSVTIPSGGETYYSFIFATTLSLDTRTIDIIEDDSRGWDFMGVELVTSPLGNLLVKADRGDGIVQNQIALKYYNGDGVPQNYGLALKWFKESAKNKVPVAFYNVGSMYLWGKGVRTDKAIARQWFEKGDLHNEGGSQYYLAIMYKNGDEVLKNPQKAKELFLKSAVNGNGNAYYELALMYKQNNQLTDAFNCFSKCADMNVNAQYEIGLMSYYGKGTPKSNQQAAYWIRKAYEGGNTDAKKVWEGLELWKYATENKSAETKKQISMADTRGTDDKNDADLGELRERKPTDENKPVEQEEVYEKVDILPSYPGGDSEMYKFIATNLKYPTIAAENGIEGRVTVRFVVGKLGNIRDITVVRSLDPSCDKEAVRVIKAMPLWNPGTQNGEAVAVYFTLPIGFKLSK